MTLKVGDVCRGTWAGEAAWLGITGIEELNNGNTMIRFRRLLCQRMPICLWWLGPAMVDRGAEFVARLDRARDMDAAAAAAAHAISVARSMTEIEIRYR